MERRSLLYALVAAIALAACTSFEPRDVASTSARPFASERISIVTRGTGPDIVLIHGLPAHRDVWAGVATSLDDRFRLHLVQMNGLAGFAPGANADGQVAAPVAEEIARYIHTADLERPAVIGHSMGGSIAMMLAARHSDIIGRLMVVDSTPFVGVAFGPPGTTAESVRPFADQMRKTILAQTPGSPDNMLEQMITGMTRKEAMRPVLLQYARDSHPPTVANAFHELIVTDLRPELSRITAPMTVLYVFPTGMPMPPEEFDAAVRLSFSSVSNAHLVKIEDSNHYIQLDQPARFIAKVDAFMRQ